jgi:hypothetical protein
MGDRNGEINGLESGENDRGIEGGRSAFYLSFPRVSFPLFDFYFDFVFGIFYPV